MIQVHISLIQRKVTKINKNNSNVKKVNKPNNNLNNNLNNVLAQPSQASEESEILFYYPKIHISIPHSQIYNPSQMLTNYNRLAKV